ncbi:MAG TPA: ATP-dependent helicase HrpB [Acidimicrobiales bacterium]|nr:ATP-dependent helicase HrpB [Acidimicrobiales bacterium]
MMLSTDLPIRAVLDEIAAALKSPGSAVVVVAPPGAGKSTIVPLLIESQPWCDGIVLVVEPRRVATRAAATRMAALRGERVGDRVGWRMRDDTNVSKATRIEVVTEGVLTRMLHSDAALTNVSAVVFDEFHERSLDADVGLAFTLDARSALHPELRIVVMSATLDGAAVARLLDDAPVIECTHRQHPIETTYLASTSASFDADHVAQATRRALHDGGGNVLVFAPGVYEIGQVVRSLQRDHPDTDAVEILALHGSLRPAEQDRVLAPSPSRRRVIVATSIAETSLTIDGVGAVVDSGFARISRFDPRRGMGGLTTVRVSRASADQRRGRAGRTAPGRCYRLWSELEHERLREQTPPEIDHADLASLALDLVVWGDAEGAHLRFLDPPPTEGLREAQRLLRELGIIDADSRLTEHGRRCAELPLHPRLAHCVLGAYERGHGPLACSIVALLSERMGTNLASVDLAGHVEAGRRRAPIARRAETIARRVRSIVAVDDAALDVSATGLVVALAYPDRVARRRGKAGTNRYLLVNGVGAVLPAHDPLAASEWIAVADIEARAQDARVFVAAALDRADVEALFADQMATVDEAVWDQQAHDVRATRDRRLGAIVVSRRPLDDPSAAQSALLDGIAREGLRLLPRFGDADALRSRVAFCRRVIGSDAWPDLSDAALLASLDTWLAPHLGNVDRRADLDRVDVARAVQSLVPRPLLAQLESLAPRHVTVPTGSSVAVDYDADQPVLRVRLQEVFGWSDTPRVAGGRVPVVLHLLSPAGRPIQVTADLGGFWRGSYPQVRAEMRGRYPKHDWPEDPTKAAPSRGVNRPRRAP